MMKTVLVVLAVAAVASASLVVLPTGVEDDGSFAAHAVFETFAIGSVAGEVAGAHALGDGFVGAGAARAVVVAEWNGHEGGEAAWIARAKSLFGAVRPAYVSGRNMVYAVDAADVDAVVGRVARGKVDVVVVPSSPIAAPSNSSVARMKAFAAKVKDLGAPNPVIAGLVASVEPKNAAATLDYLTGVSSSITTRNSFSTDILEAAVWLEKQLEALGFETERQFYRTDMGPNVVGTLKGRFSDATVVLGAHYDSRSANGNSPTDPAPGANDDGSGSASLLEAARVLTTAELSYDYTLVVAFFSGEEQGLFGSKALAAKLKADGTDVVAMLQSDMVAYRTPGNPIEIGLLDRNTSPFLNDALLTIYELYLPATVRLGYAPVCCTDSASFTELGFLATAQFESISSRVLDPMYHNVGDVVDRPGFDIDGELATHCQALVASALTFLGV